MSLCGSLSDFPYDLPKHCKKKWQVHHKIRFSEGGSLWSTSVCEGFHFCFACFFFFLFWVLVVLLFLFCFVVAVGCCSGLFVVVGCCCCFRYYCCCCCFVVIVVVCCLLFFIGLLFLLFCYFFFAVCLPKNTPTNKQKNYKNPCFIVFLPFVPGKALPRERPTTPNPNNTKGLFSPPQFLFLVVFISHCVSFF